MNPANISELEAAFEGDLDLLHFYVVWLKNELNATAAYREIHKNVTPGSAEVLGSRMLGKVKEKIGLESVMSVYGLDLNAYIKQLQEGISATKWNDFTGESEPDHKTRQGYHDKLGKILGIEKGGEPPSLVQNNYYNLTDEQLDQLIESKKRQTGITEAITGEGTENSGEPIEVRQEPQ